VSTRSLIAVRQDDAYRYIYCHWDGYVEHQWPILTECYDDLDKVNELIDLGDLSSLGREIGEAHDFEAHRHDSGWCLAYGRDRGEEDTGSRIVDYIEDILHGMEDVVYWFEDGKWNCNNEDELQEFLNAQETEA